tara:strand:+ start:13924 stop:18531 length:4608 start_codon:yes stop_codon:yes gene_type:complete
MEILQPYNNTTLQLISDESQYQFNSNDLIDGIIKLSVFSDVGSYLDGEDLQQDIDFYVKNDDLFIKPNEYLDRNGFAEGNYNVQYDFLKRLDTSNFHIAEISPSRKEVRLNIVSSEIDDDTQDIIVNFMQGENDNYQFNSHLEISQGRLIPINGFAFDNVTGNKRTLIIKLNEALPSNVVVLSTDFNISNKFLSSQTETIFFIDREGLAVSGLGLEIDQGYLTTPTAIDDSYSNYNSITSSVSENLVEEITRQQKDLNLNIDYETFSGHVFFGSAKSKLQGFKNKAVKLEGLYSDLSSSLAFSSSLKIVERRKHLFKEIRKVEDEFTHYEHFMYNDGQTYSTSSAPGVSNNLAGTKYTNLVDNDFTTLQDHEGFDRVYKKTENGTIHLFTDVYNVEQPPFYSSDDNFYLSFILRGAGTVSEYDLNFASGGFANERYDKSGGGEVGNYGYFNDRQIPFNAWSGSILANPETTGSNYQRYIFKAKQHFFRPVKSGNFALINGLEDYSSTSTSWEILSGSNPISASTSGSIGDGFAYGFFDLTGVYNPFVFPNQIQDDGTLGMDDFVTGSILPQGDLFPLFTGAQGSKEAFFTDVVVSKNNPTNIHPFSKIYRPPSGSYAGSSEWNSWYNTMETIAEDYDNDNIHSLVNNLPEFLRTGNEHKVLRDFVNMLGEQFDLLRSYIDNYHNIYKLGYKNPNAMPDNLLPVIGKSLGFDLRNPLSGSLDDYLESTRGDEVGDKKAIGALWTKILNNLVYIYKTRGTQEGINTILSLYGYDPTSFTLTEYGGSREEHNPSVVTNNAANDLDNGLKNVTGNVSFKEKTEKFNTMNFSKKENKLALDWYSNDAEPNGVEFVMKTTKTNNEQKVLRSSGSNGTGDNWDVRIVPSASSDTVGKVEFRLNSSVGSAGAIGNNAVTMSTDYIDNINDNKFFNIMLQKDIVTQSTELTQSYSLFVGRQDGDALKDVQHISMSTANVNANKNFMTASGQTSSNFIVGDEMTGSIGEVRAWDSVISMSKFKQHILNYKSVVGGTATAPRDNLVYHFPLDEGKNATTIKDISSPNKVKNFNKPLSSQPNLSAVTSSVSTVKNFSFQVRGTDAIKSDRQYYIGSGMRYLGELSPDTRTIGLPYNPQENQEIINKIGKSYSYVDAIDAIVINAMSDFVLDDYIDDYDNNGIYDDLLTLRKQLIEERLISTDVVKNLSSVESRVDNPEFIASLEENLAARTKLEFSYEVKNDTLFRSRIKRASLQTQLNPNQAIGSASLLEPSVSINFNENKHEKSIDVLTDEVSISGLLNQNKYEKSIDVLTDEVTITSTVNDKVHTNESAPLDIINLSDSSNQTVLTLKPSNFTDLLLGSKNEFYKNHGKSEEQTFFKSSNQGANGDYNTYKYESRFFFRAIGDIEEFFPTSGSYKNRTGTNAKQPFNHHDNFRHFGNRYYVDSGSGYTYSSFFGSDDATVDGRMVGRTLFFKTDSDGNITYPINHFFKVGTSKDGLTNLIYKGTQNDGTNPPQFDPELDVSPTIPAYVINVGGSDTDKKLKVIR